MKTQVVVDKQTKQIICTAFASGKTHDFKLFKQSKVYAKPETKLDTDTGYLEIKKIHANSEHPIKGSKYHKLTEKEKAFNKQLSSGRVLNEHMIGFIKRFKILADRYRNRRKRFGLRFNLIAGICNFDMKY
jgi:hypothetical protein